MSLERKILAGFIGCAVIMTAVAFYSFRNSAKLVDTNEWVNHTHEVLYEFEQVLAATVDAETGMRGYVISGQESFLEPFLDSKNRVQQHLVLVTNLTTDNPVQQQNIERLKGSVDDVMTTRTNLLELYKTDPDEVRKRISSGEAKRLQDKVRADVAVCRQLENELLVERRAESDRDTRFFYGVFIVLLVVIACVLGIVYLIIRSNLRTIKKAEQENSDKNWLLAGSVELNEKVRGEIDDTTIANEAISHLCGYLKAQVGVIYLASGNQLQLAGSYAFDIRKQNKKLIEMGEGLVGQAASERRMIVFTEVPQDYMLVNSGLGHSVPKNVVVLPLVLNDMVRGVVEIGITRQFSDLDMRLLKIVAENLSVVISAAQSRTKLKELLEETQRQAEELEAQQEELRQANEELQEKTNLLERSESELKAQQEELQQSNEELEEKANLLEGQKKIMEEAKMEIETKAREIEATSKYKSEFLANMSHELRTPLNSILILSQILTENKSHLLGDKEVQFASNIYNSGSDLLNLINEILDLSKVEAGKMELDINDFPVADVVEDIDRMFTEIAKSKSIDFEIATDNGLKSLALSSDRQRVGQILKNLLSNALKFTPKGGKIKFGISPAGNDVTLRREDLKSKPHVIAFRVSDNGIGIPQEKLGIIFEAFQQVDGSTKRKYGGTGLGLSISRELANTLGGEIHVQSEEGKGSTFTLYLPSHFDAHSMKQTSKRISVKEKFTERVPVPQSEVELTSSDDGIDDRHIVTEHSKTVLIMEDDPMFAKLLLDFVRERGYKGVIAHQGNTGLSFARHYKPDAIMLDMKLPVMDGVEVLKQLKNDPDLRHIPVQVISGYDKKREGLELGAFDFIRKPVTQDVLWKAFDKIEGFISRKLKHLLVVEDDKLHNDAVKELIGNGDVKCFSAYSGKEAYDLLVANPFDCVILDLGLPDMTGFDLLEMIRKNDDLAHVPIVVYTGKDLTKEENTRLEKLAKTVVLKTAFSSERLLDEVMLFLHRVESKLPKDKQTIIRKLHRTDEVLRTKKVLIVDDDIRNVYSLTNALEPEGMLCMTAENGKEALKALKQNQVDIVLMDVMMPEMDGYETTREIRKMDKFKKLPIIALTAKAMKGDREKCLSVGMSDYISKPLNVERLLSLMRVWLYQ
ncbi:MAG TPA: response regulator [Cyclobacteriaceae bacterium]|nr:response regulator [Cyclobacteriaceae bacterium]